MTSPWGEPKRVYLVILLAAALNVAPMAFDYVGGDILFQFAMLDCFANQFWQGDIYPRWCFSANAGLGAPLFLFYFPLSFYVTALIHPMLRLGVDLYWVYIVGVFLATVVTGATAYAWLKEIVSPGRALLAMILLLFAPYRMELLLSRVAYAELWAFALMPLLFLYSRRLVSGDKIMGRYGLLVGIMWLTHVPCVAIGSLFSGIYVFIMSGKSWQPKIRFVYAGLLGGALAAFQLIPAVYYKQFSAGDELLGNYNIWANSFFNFNYLDHLTLYHLATILVLSLMVLLPLALLLTHRLSLVPDLFLRREITTFVALLLIAILLLLPISKPLYDLTSPLSQIFFPWRMQFMFVMCIAYFSAVYMQYYASERRLRTWKADYGLAVAFLVLLTFFSAHWLSPESYPLMQVVKNHHYISAREYRSQWTDKEQIDFPHILERSEQLASIPKTSLLSGKGKIDVEQWNWQGIVLAAHAQTKMKIRLDHRYFPIWRAYDETRQELPLSPEAHTGQMLLDIPPGDYRVTVEYNSANGAPLLVNTARIASLLAAMILAFCLWRERRHAV